MSRIPIRRAGSTDLPPTRDSKTFPSGKNQSSERKEESATMKVWKLIRPGLHRHLALPGMYTCTHSVCWCGVKVCFLWDLGHCCTFYSFQDVHKLHNFVALIPSIQFANCSVLFTEQVYLGKMAPYSWPLRH